MTNDPLTLIAAGVPIVAAIVWLVRLEGRINVGDVRHDDLVSRLTRIENKIDKANGYHQ